MSNHTLHPFSPTSYQRKEAEKKPSSSCQANLFLPVTSSPKKTTSAALRTQRRNSTTSSLKMSVYAKSNAKPCLVCPPSFLSPFAPLSNLVASPRTPAAIRSILQSRFLTYLNITRLPLFASPTDPHVPIYTSPNLSTASRVIVYFGEEVQDLGVFALRTISQATITSGSALDFVSAIQSSSTAEKPVGVIIANMGQLLWYRRGKRAVTRATWAGLPRKTGVSQQLIIDPEKNRVPGNENLAAHTKYIFEHVIARMVNPAAKLDIIGLGEGAEEVVDYLQHSWETWKERILAIVVGSGYKWPSSDIRNPEFADFWGKVLFPRPFPPPFTLTYPLHNSAPAPTSSPRSLSRPLCRGAKASAATATPQVKSFLLNE